VDATGGAVKNKQTWLDMAEVIDAWRVVPRGLIVTFVTFTVCIVSNLLAWYMDLPAAERVMEASGFAFGVITAITGLLTAAIKIYVSTGRNWDDSEKPR
jgi:hypothetical protein